MKLVILVGMSILMLGCEFSDGPNGSWSVGDPDKKGVYAFIEDNGNAKDRIYKGVIYSVKDESVIYDGEFDYSLHTQIDYQNSNVYDRWDGKRLYLKDNSFLYAINEVPTKK